MTLEIIDSMSGVNNGVKNKRCTVERAKERLRLTNCKHEHRGWFLDRS